MGGFQLPVCFTAIIENFFFLKGKKKKGAKCALGEVMENIMTLVKMIANTVRLKCVQLT